MKSKRLPLWLGAIGVLLLVPRILWVASAGSRLSDDDARVALQPLKRIQLDRIDHGPISVTLLIPNTTQWTKMRKVWREPEFAISAIDTGGALCLPDMPVRMELIDATGRVVPLQLGGPPYGYSSTCVSSSLWFHAAPGNELTLKLLGTRPGTIPAGDLIVVTGWFNTKDKLVGQALDKDVEQLVKLPSIPGFVLLVLGGAVFLANRIRHHAVN